MPGPRGWWSFGALVMVCTAVEARAQALLSPGPLAAPHRDLEGLENCLKCHAGGQRVAMARCLTCHEVIAHSLSQHTGVHGRLAPAQLSCEGCHHEHLGQAHSLLPWKSDKSDFDHATTGYPLLGGHTQVACHSCHDPRRIKDAQILRWQRERPGQAQFFGLSTRCEDCHFDEHRGQEKQACGHCHTEKAWKSTTFKHADTAYPLTGKHADVSCGACHARLPDTQTPAHAFPAPVSRWFEHFVGVPHALCTDCHRDPHEGSLGPRCATCHSTAGWKIMTRTAADTGFHDKTRFPLRGAHSSVDCHACHGPFPGKPAVFRGMAFDKCSDCHADAHENQLAGDCKGCHTVAGFLPPAYTVEQHESTLFPLRGAHAAVACNQCHALDPALDRRIPAAVRAALHRNGREQLFSMARFETQADVMRCDSCHLTPHGQQFAGRIRRDGCTDCHREDTFHAVRFDHELESRFPLTGAHARAPCQGCHGPEVPAAGVAPVVRYVPQSRQCISCHVDVHAGQFLQHDGRDPCETCHTTERFAPSTFDHNDPNRTSFALEGAHRAVACSACHLDVALAAGTKVAHYRPTVATCDGCHADYHQNAFAGLMTTLGGNPNQQPACDGCHSVQSWLPADFTPHAKTAFALQGAHRSVACNSCHTRGFARPLPMACGGCHSDAHAGELGTQCSACHSQDTWEAEMTIEAHRRTNFPLRGAHGALPCQECHPAAFAHDYRGVGATCYACHQADYLRAAATSVNHAASGFATTCRACHDPWSFTHARMDTHDTCFLLSRGPHAALACASCHTALAGTIANGSCSTNTAACTGCHTHAAAVTQALHHQVEGYAYQDRKCYECHTFTVAP